MSANVGLSQAELQEMVPTIRSLILDCWDHDHELWGLCQHSDDGTQLSFRLPDGKWELIASLKSIIDKHYESMFGVDFDSVGIFYAVDVVKPHDVDLKIINFTEEESPPEIQRSLRARNSVLH